jgi:hypothetical protein
MEIDAVITYVNGADENFILKRDFHLNSSNSISEIRYKDNQELKFCLRSIFKNAPWIRKIFIVTDDQFPTYFDKEHEFFSPVSKNNKIIFIDHKEIFEGYEYLLPTFNSQSIEGMLWRIKGLSEHFIYFNDDMFLLPGATPNHFFDNKFLLRGRWSMPFKPWHQTRINAAALFGFTKDLYFLESHTPYPLKKSVFFELFTKFKHEYINNLKFKFRNPSQKYPVSMHNHYLISTCMAQTALPKGNVILDTCIDRLDATKLSIILEKLTYKSNINACINNLGSYLEKNPDFSDVLNLAFGPPLPFEIKIINNFISPLSNSNPIKMS